MKIKNLRLAGLQLVLPSVHFDERGYFFESHKDALYQKHGIGPFVQDNTSFSIQNTIRALHFQSGPGQAKLISCLKGEIWDVAVDIRPDSETYLKWEAVILNGKEPIQFYIPAGFAHGFCVLSPEAIVHYKVSTAYEPSTEKSIRWNDPTFNIAWPVSSPILSARDQTSPYFNEVKGALDYRK
jgi:dTDP-4-dehydrorhamnose 3,5-epimerase